MNFKEMAKADIKNVFLNLNEFADMHTVIYDGETYADIPVVLTKVRQKERELFSSVDDRMQGVHIISVVAHMALSDIGGNEPEQNQIISIDNGTALGKPFFQKYRIITSDCEMGMVNLELEAFDE